MCKDGHAERCFFLANSGCAFARSLTLCLTLTQVVIATSHGLDVCKSVGQTSIESLLKNECVSHKNSVAEIEFVLKSAILKV